MGILMGPFDPIKLILGIINILLKKRVITLEESREVLKNSLDQKMPDEEKEDFLDSITTKIDG